jgi:AAA domain, putative AbiEii toxin, Type IV TA system
MLERLHLKNVGPAPELEMEFAPRVNLITGDNGLGKSFILDVAFSGLTKRIFGGITPFRPSIAEQTRVSLPTIANQTLLDKFNILEVFHFNYREQKWEMFEIKLGRNKRKIRSISKERLSNPVSLVSALSKQKPKVDYSVVIGRDRVLVNPVRLVIYQRIDGSFTISKAFASDSDLEAHLELDKVFDGLEQNGKFVSNGLIRDWARWQLENGEPFRQFQAALQMLSPHEGEKLEPGDLSFVFNDSRDMPTLKMPYGQQVPITQVSAGIKRIVSLAYILVWTWQQHMRDAELMQRKPAREIVLLIDELEQHLHPRWQRVILPALLETVKELMKSDVRVQIIATTHSPMVLASLEPLYEDTQDAWFDLNLVKGKVTLERMPWRKRGDASAWLTSEAFDLPSSGSLDREGAMDRAAKAMGNPKLTKKAFLEHDQALRGVLGETDPFWVRWRFMGEKKGWL